MSGNYDDPFDSNRGFGRRHLRNLLNSAGPNRQIEHSGLASALLAMTEEFVDRESRMPNSGQTTAMVDWQNQQSQSDHSGREGSIRHISSSHEQEEVPSSTSNPTPMNREPNTSETLSPAGRYSRRRPLATDEVSARGGRPRELELASSFTEPLSHVESSSSTRPGPQSNRSRAKRRKLESDDNSEGLRGFTYGQYGQVVPGALKMDIVSSDGGAYEPEGDSSWPENILENDFSVYCTKSDQCNLILKHRGETPFCLRKIAIKAPRCGYDAPIREGMIFVSMTSEDLLSRTSQYQNESKRRNRQSIMHRYRNNLHPSTRAGMRSAQTNNDNSTAEFRVTTTYDDQSEDDGGNDGPESDDDVPSVAEIERIHMADQIEDDLFCPESDDSESDDDISGLSSFNRRSLQQQSRGRVLRQRDSLGDQQETQRHRLMPGLIDPMSTAMRGGSNYSSRPNPQTPDPLEPHAHFFIERDKKMVNIKFDPPPSGRFILIKLWSPYAGGNIDIQSIIIHGFAGPRFFPAGNFR